MLRGTGFGTFPRGISAVLDSEPCDEARVVRDVVFDGEVHPTPVLRRSGLRGELAGPAIVVEETATTVIPPGCLASVDDNGFLIIKVCDRK